VEQQEKKELLIVVDAGHGGWDNGASSSDGERLEKDDNLRLALQVQKELLCQGVPVLMTRDTDVFVSLQDRAAMANEAGADLFVSLHRNSFPRHTPNTNGVQNYIYLTAPESTERAAQLVLNQVVDVGVQSNWGVLRGDYYVLRRTAMPAMLLEMGFIIDAIDNILFDKHFYDYAAAIAKGVMEYFGLVYKERPERDPANTIEYVQNMVNNHFGLTIPLTGSFDESTRYGMIQALQMALNWDFGFQLEVNGRLDAATVAAIPNIQKNQQGNAILVLQALLWLNGYDAGPLDGKFRSHTFVGLCTFQKDNFIPARGIGDSHVIRKLLEE